MWHGITWQVFDGSGKTMLHSCIKITEIHSWVIYNRIIFIIMSVTINKDVIFSKIEMFFNKFMRIKFFGNKVTWFWSKWLLDMVFLHVCSGNFYMVQEGAVLCSNLTPLLLLLRVISASTSLILVVFSGAW